MPTAQAALAPYKNLKHPKIRVEFEALNSAWKTTEESVQREDNLMRLNTKIVDKIQERSNQIDALVSKNPERSISGERKSKRKLSNL